MIDTRFLFVFGSLVALSLASGCDDPASETGPGAGGGGNMAGAGPVGSYEVFPLVPNPDGFVPADATMNPTNVTGSWYAYGDSLGDMKCTTAGGHTAAECSVISAPTGTTFANTGGRMCTSGTAAKVINMGASPDYSNIFGTGIGIDFNNPGMGAPKAPFDASAYVGIQFKIEGMTAGTPGIPASGLRIEFPVPATEGSVDGSDFADAGGNNTWPTTKLTEGLNTIEFTRIQSPTKPTGSFDKSKMLGVQIHVPTNTTSATPFAYCISDFALVKAK